MMTHAFRGKIARASLFAGDADFVPLVKALVSEGLHVTLWHPPQATRELKGAADSTRPFSTISALPCLTLDGKTAAFQQQSSGSAHVPINENGIDDIRNKGTFNYAGKWKDSIFTIYFCYQDQGWTYSHLVAKGSTAEQAAKASIILNQLDIELGDLSWIKIIK